VNIIRFDHAVLLMNDERRARPFYLKVLGAELDHDFVRTRNGRDFHRSFLNLGNGHGLGLFEDRTPVPSPRSGREWPAVVFRVPADSYEATVRAAEAAAATAAGNAVVREQVNLAGQRETAYLLDTEGNGIGLTPGDGTGPAATLARLEFDVGDLDVGIGYYQDVLGLDEVETGILPGHLPYAWFPLRQEDQGVLLVEREDAPGRNPGQHFAFLVGRDDHLAARERLASLGVEQVPGHEGPRPENEIGTYVIDPWGRKLQWITNPDTP
jgi:catechol 2,3-dioxygenase-like lactoylglutathione lyase family enzyme